VNIGTGAFIQQPLLARPAEPAPLLGSILCVDETGPLYSIEGTVNGAGSAVAWFANDSHTAEAVLWEELEALPDEIALPLFINGVGGIGSPWWQPGSVAEFIGAGSTVERFAAVIESIAFLIALNVERMRTHHGSLSRVVLTGGLSRSAWLCRHLASVLGLGVERCAAEATARGIATLAAPILADSWHAPIEQRFEARFLPEVTRRFVRFRQLMSERFG
jgi:glycerol kinase